ncbi:WD40/YVTN/BNR-like repeat-containing protein [Aliidiomarina quisquiliarum]|uniref:WD40/YVTN/BNR-like repeat-containing protein n=1 Tax=Aliidiomarina quisquiliarum TaxID=2938947 RepID=UPI00208E4410|nr:hypothetical protein [Aliidiomarina quisquiliarum]MCO4320327.1 hypothetical protein [Aliidiomarina quisquiliarum]
MILYRTPLLLSLIILLPATFFATQAKATVVATSADINLPQEHRWVSLSAVNNVVWAGSDDGYVALSMDAGNTFELSRLAADASLQQLHVRQLTVLDDHHGYALTSGEGARSGLYITRNGGFSWRPLYRGEQQEQLRCMAINPTGEAWILGDSQNEHWHVVRSNNGKHWNTSRSGFAKRTLPGEQASNTSDSCVRFENNTWLMGTQNAAVARIMFKEDNALRFQVSDTPLAGISAVWPLNPTTFLLAGGNATTSELYTYQQGEFNAVNTPAMHSAIEVLFQQGDKVFIGNQHGAYVSQLEQTMAGNAKWESILSNVLNNSEESIGARAFTCSSKHCWLLGTDNQLYQVNTP